MKPDADMAGLREALDDAEKAVARLPHSARCIWQQGDDDCDCHKADALSALARAALAATEGPTPEVAAETGNWREVDRHIGRPIREAATEAPAGLDWLDEYHKALGALWEVVHGQEMPAMGHRMDAVMGRLIEDIRWGYHRDGRALPPVEALASEAVTVEKMAKAAPLAGFIDRDRRP
jgi:hypothetical protein